MHVDKHPAAWTRVEDVEMELDAMLLAQHSCLCLRGWDCRHASRMANGLCGGTQNKYVYTRVQPLRFSILTLLVLSAFVPSDCEGSGVEKVH